MSNNEQILRNMTPARILESESGDHIEVVFLESAQFYSLRKENPAFDSIITILRNAMKEGLSVEVRLASLVSDIIEDIKE
jgi:hypothetical protein